MTTTSLDNTGSHAAGKLWGGRFASKADPALEDLSRSPSDYFRMVPYDAVGSKAHAGELVRKGLLTSDERRVIESALDELVADHRSGKVVPSPGDEDVHGYLERLLVERLGPLGGKLRAGRSRNDQTANELRLFLRDVSQSLASQAGKLVEVLVARAVESKDVIAPGFTHLQPAQPIVFGHQLMAHAFALTRDVTRLQHAWDSSSRSPLGAAALAGSSLSVDPLAAAREQGFTGITENSIDGVSSRDHVVEFLFAAAMLATDISRLCEEFCLWSTTQFGWIRLDDSFSTGSSIMPQKKNPDIAELARGKASRLNANLSGMLGVLKGLPFAYNRDLSEDKRFAFDSADTLALVLPAVAGMVRTFSVNADAMRQQATVGFTLATELADWLAEQGVPFSEAHDVTGRVVTYCEANDITLEDLTLSSVREIDARITSDALARLTVESALARRNGPGGTSPSNIAVQSEQVRAQLSETLSLFEQSDD